MGILPGCYRLHTCFQTLGYQPCTSCGLGPVSTGIARFHEVFNSRAELVLQTWKWLEDQKGAVCQVLYIATPLTCEWDI